MLWMPESTFILNQIGYVSKMIIGAESMQKAIERVYFLINWLRRFVPLSSASHLPLWRSFTWIFAVYRIRNSILIFSTLSLRWRRVLATVAFRCKWPAIQKISPLYILNIWVVYVILKIFALTTLIPFFWRSFFFSSSWIHLSLKCRRHLPTTSWKVKIKSINFIALFIKYRLAQERQMPRRNYTYYSYITNSTCTCIKKMNIEKIQGYHWNLTRVSCYLFLYAVAPHSSHFLSGTKTQVSRKLYWKCM